MPALYEFEYEGLYYSHSKSYHHISQRFHAHDFCEFYYFISGHGRYLVESSAYPLQPGTILLMRPGEVHSPELLPDTPYERIVIQFREEELSSLLEQRAELMAPFTHRPLGVWNRFTFEEYDNGFMQQLFQYIERNTCQDNAKQIISPILPVMINELCRSFKLRQSSSSLERESPSQIQSIITYINERLYDELSLDDICSHFFISKAQLGRLFRSATGSTTWDYILIKRLIEARRQILSGIPVTQAAINCGFRDYSAFFRAYKKRYQVSPAADRLNTNGKR